MNDGLSGQDIAAMTEAGKVAASILKRLGKIIAPGMATKDIENSFDMYLSQYPGMESAFKGFMGYPASLCVSINEEVIHGIPSSARIIKDGDSVSIDLGIKYKGIFVDTAHTYLVGKASRLARKLVKATLRALHEGIKKAKVGARVGDISFTIQNFIENRGFSVIRKFVGHGIGKRLHEVPEIPNFGKMGEGQELCEGMAIAIEPMVSSGGFEVEIANDGWTARTKDRSLSAHFEHTVLITDTGPFILTRL
ncbi:MAG: type I methionyl aminopeptidase [Candidatus Omnitrophota bacterium]|nr:type I methionyl aminopeptidase [Candidatus Omnitrophota bacterium]